MTDFLCSVCACSPSSLVYPFPGQGEPMCDCCAEAERSYGVGGLRSMLANAQDDDDEDEAARLCRMLAWVETVADQPRAR